MAKMASPMNFTTVPSVGNTHRPTAVSKYWFIMCARSSGSSPSEMLVKPAMSLKKTVTSCLVAPGRMSSCAFSPVNFRASLGER